jgi:shikimate dehydrogenase
MLKAQTKEYRLGLVGYPVEHSLSPRLHQAALWAAGLAGDYRLYPAPPTPEGMDSLIELLEAARQGRIDGLNVTVPYKQKVIPLLDGLKAEARRLGAVNTILNEAGRLTGENTDRPGFLIDLERVMGGATETKGRDEAEASKEALVLGTGGAARAVVGALIHKGWKVTAATRRLEQGDEIKNQIHDERFEIVSFKRLSRIVRQCRIDLIVNATPVGMWPQVEASPWPEGTELPRGAFVYDLVYNPVETHFLKTARGAGLQAANGIGMLVEQAGLAFDMWTGAVAAREAMWQAIPEYAR